MNLLRLHKFLVYLMVLIPVVLLALGGEMNPATLAIFTAGYFVSWFWEAPRVDLKQRQWVWTVLTSVAIAVMVARFFLAGDFRIEPLLDLVLILTVFKLMQRQGTRDYAQIKVLSFLLLVSGSAFNPGLMFGLSFVVYMVIATVALAVQHLREEMTAYHPKQLKRFRIEAGFMMTVGGLAFVVSLFSIAFFLLFPRVGLGAFDQFGRSPVSATGFNEMMELGDHGTIREDGTVVMRVTFPEIEGEPRFETRWRGTSFNHFDGSRWTQEGRPYRNQPAWVSEMVYSATDDAFDREMRGHPPSRRGPNDQPIKLEIYLEPLGSDLLFGMPQPLALEFPDEDPALPQSYFRVQTEFNRAGDIRLIRESTTGVRYVVYSLPEITPREVLYNGFADFGEFADWDEQRRGVRRLRGNLADQYLGLPDALTQRFYDLADQITSPFATPLERARAIEAYLEANYAYTLDLPVVDQSNPMESFLFETRTGHCEYFSTAMVLLARAAGIPARNVNGFLGGRWNPIGGYLEVRQSDAHSWTELYLPGAGWVTFDPTPPEGLPSAAEESTWTTILAFFDNVRMFWYRHVVDYNLESQINIAQAAARTFGGDGASLGEILRGSALRVAWNMPVFVAWAFIWLVFGGLLRWRKSKNRHWSHIDTVLGLSMIGLSVLAPLLLWRPEATTPPIVTGFLIPFLIVSYAKLTRARRVTLRARQRSKRRLNRVSKLYLKLLRRLGKAGIEVGISDTVGSVLEQVKAHQLSHAAELEEVLDLYEYCRYSPRPSDEKVSDFVSSLKGLLRRDFRPQSP